MLMKAAKYQPIVHGNVFRPLPLRRKEVVESCHDLIFGWNFPPYELYCERSIGFQGESCEEQKALLPLQRFLELAGRHLSSSNHSRSFTLTSTITFTMLEETSILSRMRDLQQHTKIPWHTMLPWRQTDKWQAFTQIDKYICNCNCNRNYKLKEAVVLGGWNARMDYSGSRYLEVCVMLTFLMSIMPILRKTEIRLRSMHQARRNSSHARCYGTCKFRILW